MNLKPFITAGESQTLEFKASFDKATVELPVADIEFLQGNVEELLG